MLRIFISAVGIQNGVRQVRSKNPWMKGVSSVLHGVKLTMFFYIHCRKTAETNNRIHEVVQNMGVLVPT